MSTKARNKWACVVQGAESSLVWQKPAVAAPQVRCPTGHVTLTPLSTRHLWPLAPNDSNETYLSRTSESEITQVALITELVAAAATVVIIKSLCSQHPEDQNLYLNELVHGDSQQVFASSQFLQ